MSSPLIKSLRVVPVAGHDSMLLNLSGAHGPFFTRNIVLITDSSGRTGLGEVPGGEKIRQTVEDASSLLIGQPIADYAKLLAAVTAWMVTRRSNVCRPRPPASRSEKAALTAASSFA